MDETERMALAYFINNNPKTREELEKEFGQVWDTEQAKEDFVFQGFAAPFASVVRKRDNEQMLLCFQHAPRFYWLVQ